MSLTKDTVLHIFICNTTTRSKREAVRMLKYLVEERGADPTLKNVYGQDARDVALARRDNICINYFSSLPGGKSSRVTDPAKLRRLEALEKKSEEAQAAAEAAAKATDTESTGVHKEQEAKAQEATATLLAKLDAEEQTAAAAAAKTKSKKAKNKKGAGGQQAASAAVAASTAGRGSVAEECKAEDKMLAPGRPSQREE